MSQLDRIVGTHITRRTAIKIGLFSALAPRTLFGHAANVWSFAVCSDTHYGISGHVEKNDVLLREIGERDPAFAIVAGDLTERAWPFEFDQARAAFAPLPYKVHVAPGNHDVRWAPRGPMMFEENIGPMRQLFVHNNCAFLLLDSTVPLSHFGHIGGPQERWMVESLRALPANTPLFVFMHHPVGRPAGVDDDARLARALAPFNAKVLFTAHGHADLVWQWHGMTATMSKGLYQGSYQFVTVDSDAGVVRLARRTAEATSLKTFAEIPLAPAAQRSIVAVSEALQRSEGVVNELWRRPLGGGVMSELVATGGALYVSSMDGALYSFEQASGGLRWKAQTEGYLHSSPAIIRNSVIVGSADGHVYSFARSNGVMQWRFRTGGAVYATAAQARGIVAIASGDGNVYGLDARNGRERWRFKMEDGPSSFSQSPAGTDGNRFFIGAWNQNVYALDARTGKEVWRYRATDRSFYYSAAIARPAVGNRRVYIPSNDNTLHAIDAEAGTTVWKASAPADKFGYSSPLLVGDRIFIGSLGDKGQVHCLDARSGAVLWTTDTDATIYESSPVRVRDFVGIGSVNGVLSLLRMSDGSVAGRYRFPPGHFLSTPAAAGARIFAATFAEEVAALHIGLGGRGGPY
jgi:outer membrane protein assembly factor BamB